MILKLFHGVLSVLAIIIAAYLIPGVQTTLVAAVILAVVLGAINLSIRPVLHFITMPLNILTLGLFSTVLNIALVVLAASLVPGLTITNLWTAVMFAAVLLILNGIFHFGLPR